MATSIIWGRDSGADIKLPFAGNSALLGTRIINAGASDDVALAFNEFVPDGHTVGLWHLNESEWTGAADEVIDSSGNGNHGTAHGGATTVDGWLDRAGQFDGVNDYVDCGTGQSMNIATGCMEAWFRTAVEAPDDNNGHRIVTMLRAPTSSRWLLGLRGGGVVTGHWDDSTFVWLRAAVNYWDNTWHHVAAQYDGLTFTLWFDGQLMEQQDSTLTSLYYGVLIGTYQSDRGLFDGYIDEVRISDTVRYTSDFSPHRFEPGTVTLQYNIAATPLKAVDWSLSSSPTDGKVTKVEAYNPSTAQWETLAEDSNGLQPPIYVSGVYVQGPDLIRLTLAPKNDALQSETPVLDWVRVVLGEDITVINNNEIIWGRDGSIGGGGISLKWSGNSTGDGTRIVNEDEVEDDVALAFNEYEPDEHAVGLWHMNEDAWTGATGEVIDSSGNGHHGTAYGGATTTEGWLGRCGYFRDIEDCHVEVPYATVLNPSVPLTAECWCRLRGDSPYWWALLCNASRYGAGRYGWHMMFGTRNRLSARWGDGSEFHALTSGYWEIVTGEWTHIAFVLTADTAYLFVNGTLSDSAPLEGFAPNPDQPFKVCQDEVGRYPANIDVDEVRLSNIARYTSDFSPHRYEPGAITAQYALPSQYRLTAIDWDGLLGASYGLVTKVEVNTVGQGWQVVAQDANGLTPPLINLNHIVQGPDLVRVTLVPKQDTLQSETPVLDWLRITIESTAGRPWRATALQPAAIVPRAVVPRAPLRAAPTVRANPNMPRDGGIRRAVH